MLLYIETINAVRYETHPYPVTPFQSRQFEYYMCRYSNYTIALKAIDLCDALARFQKLNAGGQTLGAAPPLFYITIPCILNVILRKSNRWCLDQD